MLINAKARLAFFCVHVDAEEKITMGKAGLDKILAGIKAAAETTPPDLKTVQPLAVFKFLLDTEGLQLLDQWVERALEGATPAPPAPIVAEAPTSRKRKKTKAAADEAVNKVVSSYFS